MKVISLRHLFTRIVQPRPPERPLHAIDRRIAREWIKKRLAALYPELRTDPEALERVYRELGLEPNGVCRRADEEVRSYAMSVPLAGAFEQR